MRQVWARAYGRWLLVAVATSVMTLALSSPIYSASRGGQAAPTAVGDCTKAEALSVATRLRLVPDPTLPNPVAGVLCGSFTGPGSQTMVATFARATCLPNYGWAAFVFTAGAWQLLTNQANGRVVISLVVAGPDFRETVPVWRKGDPICHPAGGTKARIWHWDGTRLVPGPWRQLTKGEPQSRAFHSPSGGISCGLGDSRSYRGVGCQSRRLGRPFTYNAVQMDSLGRLKICRGSAAHCRLGDAGDVPTLRYGRQITVGSFRCLSLRSGVRCSVIRSGRGFLINRSGVTPVGRAATNQHVLDASIAVSPLAAKADCSMATARQLVERHRLNAFLLPNPVRQLLCGPFTGPGSEAMAITLNAPTCWSPQGWAVFRFTEGDWQLVLHQQRVFIFSPLVAVGADIRERTPVFRQGDPRCIPSGGSHARIWHWDGTRFTAGPWKQVTPPVPTTSGYFKTPSGNIACDYQTLRRPYVRCGIKSGLKPPPPPKRPGCFRTNRISLGASGRARLGASICPGDDEGDAGPFAGKGVARVLDYGKAWSGGGLRCTSAFRGLTCRNRSGHGFFLSRALWRRF